MRLNTSQLWYALQNICLGTMRKKNDFVVIYRSYYIVFAGPLVNCLAFMWILKRWGTVRFKHWYVLRITWQKGGGSESKPELNTRVLVSICFPIAGTLFIQCAINSNYRINNIVDRILLIAGWYWLCEQLVCLK